MADNSTRRLVANIRSETHQRLRVEASIRDTTVTSLVQQAVDRWLDKEASDLSDLKPESEEDE